jgi:hypothetical protein
MLAFPVSMTKKIQKRSMYTSYLDILDISPLIDIFRSIGSDVICCYDKENGYIFPYCSELEYSAGEVYDDSEEDERTKITIYKTPLVEDLLYGLSTIIKVVDIEYNNDFVICSASSSIKIPFGKIDTITLVAEKMNIMDITELLEVILENTDIKDQVTKEIMNNQFFADQFGYIVSMPNIVSNVYDEAIENTLKEITFMN